MLISLPFPTIFLYSKSLGRAQQTSLVQVLHLFISWRWNAAHSSSTQGWEMCLMLTCNKNQVNLRFFFEQRKVLILMLICRFCWGWQCGIILRNRETALLQQLSLLWGEGVCSSWPAGSWWLQTTQHTPVENGRHTCSNRVVTTT